MLLSVFLGVIAVLVQFITGAYAFRMKTHPPDTDSPMEKHFWGFFIVALIGMSSSAASLCINSEASRESTARILQMSEQLKQAKSPVLSEERIGMKPVSKEAVGVAMEVFNRGGSTALNAHVFIFLVDIGKNEQDWESQLKYSESEARGTSTIAPQASRLFRTDTNVPKKDLDFYVARQDYIFLVGSLWWEDSNRHKQERPFCYSYAKDGLFESRKPRTCRG